MSFLSTSSVELFPAALRKVGTAKYTTENNLSQIIRTAGLSDSYLIDRVGNNYEFVIKGHYFSISAQSPVYDAAIVINNNTKTLVAIEDGALDLDTTSDGLFKGLYIRNSSGDSSISAPSGCTLYSLILSDDNRSPEYKDNKFISETFKSAVSANKFYAGPSTGNDAIPAFRPITSDDLPEIFTSNVSAGVGIADCETPDFIPSIYKPIHININKNGTIYPGQTTIISGGSAVQLSTPLTVGYYFSSIIKKNFSAANLIKVNSPLVSSWSNTTSQLIFDFGSQSHNYVFAGPSESNSADAVPAFRALTSYDLPSISWNKLTSVPSLNLVNQTVDTTTNSNLPLLFAPDTAAGGDKLTKYSSNLYYNPATSVFSAPIIDGTFIGTISGATISGVTVDKATKAKTVYAQANADDDYKPVAVFQANVKNNDYNSLYYRITNSVAVNLNSGILKANYLSGKIGISSTDNNNIYPITFAGAIDNYASILRATTGLTLNPNTKTIYADAFWGKVKAVQSLPTGTIRPFILANDDFYGLEGGTYSSTNLYVAGASNFGIYAGTKTIAAATFSGNLIGNVTGNANTATTAVNATNATNTNKIYTNLNTGNGWKPILVTSVSAKSSNGYYSAYVSDAVAIKLDEGIISAPVFSGNLIGNVTGNADTATKLGTTTIGGATTPIYLNAGTPKSMSATRGGSGMTSGSGSWPSTPYVCGVYLNGGAITGANKVFWSTSTAPTVSDIGTIGDIWIQY